MTLAPSNGLKIHYQDTGSGPPLVLLAGFTVSGLVWPAAWVSALEEHHRLLRVCNRGTGRSDVPEERFTIADMADDVIAVLDAAGIARASVLGWSMGGIVTQELASSSPDRVERLILADTWPPGGAIRTDALTFGSGSVWTGLAGERHLEAEELRVLDAAYNEHPPPLEGIVHQIQALQEWTVDERELTVSQPALVLHGADDPLIPVDNGRQLAKLIPGAQYVELEGVGHMFAWEEPARTASLINAFLAE